MAKTATTGEEYKILKQKSTPKRIAKIFTLVWIIVVMAPILYITITKDVVIKEYAVVRGVYEANNVLMEQYKDLSDKLMSKVDISKYTSKIEIPEIKLDKVNEATQTVNQATTALSKLGVKGMDKVQDTTNKLQQQVDKVNAQIK